MYRIPGDLNLDEIIDAEIAQVCMGRYIIQFHFTSGTKIAVEGEITLLNGEKVAAEWDAMKNWTSPFFQRILNVRVLNYSVVNERLLQIHLEGGMTLQLHDNSDELESFLIYPINDEHIIVV